MSLIVNDDIEQQRDEIAHLERRRKKVLQEIAAYQEELPRQVRAWNQRQEEIPLQRKRALADLKNLEAEEQRRLTPLLVQLSPLLKRDAKAVQAMQDAETTRLAEEALLAPLQRGYARQWTPYQAEMKKLERLRAHQPFPRFFVQLFIGEWEKALETSVEDLAAPLRTLQEQIIPIQERLAEAKQTYKLAEKQHQELQPAIAAWIRIRAACTPISVI